MSVCLPLRPTGNRRPAGSLGVGQKIHLPGKRLFATLLLTWTLLPAQAATAASAPALLPQFRALDTEVQALKQSVLALASANRPSATPPAEPTQRIYLGLRAGSWRLRGLSLWIDEGEPYRYNVEEDIAAAAPRAALQEASNRLLGLARLGLAAGPHQLRAEFVASPSEPRGDTDTVSGKLERRIDISDGETQFELVLDRAAGSSTPALALTEWRSDLPKPGLIARLAAQTSGAVPAVAVYEPGSAGDPALRAALSLLQGGQAFSAALALRSSSITGSREQQGLLAQALLAFGAPADSAAALLFGGPGDEAKPLKGSTLCEAALMLADRQYRHGDDAKTALATLDALPESRLTAAQLQKANELRALILLSQQRYAEAAKRLAAIQSDPLKLMTATPEVAHRGLIFQYDLGVALMRSGALEQGRGVLDRLGQYPAQDSEALALRDKANLSLGWSFLRAAQGATARPVLERVRLDGPYSSQALLGLGWADLAPQGRRQIRQDVAAESGSSRDTPKFVLNVLQRRRLIDCEEYNRRAIAPPNHCSGGESFGQGEIPADAKQLTASALLPWRQLLERDPQDPAVQEARNAVPYALGLLGNTADAKIQYEAAIAAHETSLSLIDTAINALRDSPVPIQLPITALRQEPSSRLTTDQLSHVLEPVSGLVAALLEDDLYADTLANLGDLAWLQQWLAAVPPALPAQGDADDSRDTAAPAALSAAASKLQQRHAALLNQLALAALDERKARLGEYLAAARTGLARLYDPALTDRGGKSADEPKAPQ